MRLHLVLSGRCNLACAYCYQGARRVRPRMSLATVGSALKNVLASGEEPHRVALSGGEPFLDPARLRRVIRLVRELGPAEAIDIVVQSNGTLVTDADLDLLAARDVGLQVSADGVRSAQARRAPRTFRRANGLLDRARQRRPGWARRRLAVSMTLQAVTVPTLAGSLRHFLSKGLTAVRVEPLLTHDPEWTEVTRARLSRQLEPVLELSLEHWGQTGEIPIDFLRAGTRELDDEAPPPGPATRPRFLCAAPTGQKVTVDPDGHAWACPVFTASLQDLPPLGQVGASMLDLGNVQDRGFAGRLAALPARVGPHPLLTAKKLKWSSRGRCRDCPVARECLVCPVSTAHIPGNHDPHRIPDNQCDFQYLTLHVRRRFQGEIKTPGLLRNLQRHTHGVRRLVEALAEERSATPTGRVGA